MSTSILRIPRIGHADGDILGEEPTCEVGTQLRKAGPRMLATGLAQSLGQDKNNGQDNKGSQGHLGGEGRESVS